MNLGVKLFFVCFIFAESADLEAESQAKAPTLDQDIDDDDETIGAVGGMSSAESTSSLYASEKFYSDQESDDDEYKDPISDNFAQSKSYYVASFIDIVEPGLDLLTLVFSRARNRLTKENSYTLH